MKKYRAVILISFLAGITLFSVVKFITTQRENYRLSADVGDLTGQVSDLSKEKQNLLQTIEKQNEDNATIKENLKVTQDKLTKVETDVEDAKKNVETLNTEVSQLRSENNGLKDQADTLKTQLTQESQEKDALSARLNSIAELKKAIRELKIRMRDARIAKHERAKPTVLAQEPSSSFDPNYGFLVKDGKSTFPPKIKIEVTPAH